MKAQQLIRIVALRKGKLKPSEFRLRERERGLSLFVHSDNVGAAAVVDAVRVAGKQGELAAAVLESSDLRSLGLVLVGTPGELVLHEVNAIHLEARLPLWRKVLLLLRGVRPYDYFNDVLSAKLCALARLLD